MEAWSEFWWFCVVSLSVTFGGPLTSVWVYQTNCDPQALGPRRRLWQWDTHILSWSSIYRAAFLILLKSGSCPWVCYSVQCAGRGNHHHHHEWQLTLGCQRSLAHESYPELAVRPLLETENRIQYFLCLLRLTTFCQVVQGRMGNEDHLQQDTFLMVLKIDSTSNTMNISALRGCHKPASSEEAMLQNSQDTISLMRFFVFVVLKDVFTMPLSSQNLSDAMKLNRTQSAH